MVVSAISAFSNVYSTYTQIDVEHEEIKKKLRAMGLEVTGRKTVDKSTLEHAQKEKELEGAQKTASEQSQTTTQTTPTLTDKISEDNELRYILNQLGVTPTEDLDKDYRNAIKAFQNLFRTETDMAELSHLRKMKFDLDKIVSAYGFSTIGIAASEMSGATALAEMNKVMMLKGGSFNSSGK